MTTSLKHEASIPNPARHPLSVLIGEWTTVGTHQLVPGTTFHGHTSFEWLEGGAFLMMHSEIDEPGIPSGIAIFGSDDALGRISCSTSTSEAFQDHTTLVCTTMC